MCTLIHYRKTASIEIDVQILTHLIAHKLNTCAPHWYREHFHVVVLFLFLFSVCFYFALLLFLARFHFISAIVRFYYFISFFPFRPMWILVFRSVSLHVMLHTTFDTYILALVNRMCVCVCILVFRVICFIRSCLALVCFFFMHFARSFVRIYFIAH